MRDTVTLQSLAEWVAWYTSLVNIAIDHRIGRLIPDIDGHAGWLSEPPRLAPSGYVYATTSSPSSSSSSSSSASSSSSSSSSPSSSSASSSLSPSSSSDTPTPNQLAKRFLPPPVDPSHVISSAAPSSLPIELPAIRANNCPDDPSTSTSTSSPASSSSSSPSNMAMATATATAISSSSQSAATYAATLSALPTFQRWTLRASESQFNALAGAIGGFTAGVVTCPLDVIKTKLQAQGGFAALQRQQQAAAAAATAAGTTNSAAASAGTAAGQNHHRIYNGLIGTARVIWRDEGIRGLYRGLGPIIMGYLPTWAVWFTIYNKSKIWMGERYHLENTFVINFWSSVIAGASSTIVTNPIWVIKTRLMSQMPASAGGAGGAGGVGGAGAPPGSALSSASASAARPALAAPWHYRSTIDAARKMYATEGILSFYSGLTPALLGLTHVAVQFPAYEYFKTKFTGVGMGQTGDGSDGDSGGGVEAPTHWLGVLSATILSKMLASSLTYPHEVIRTRLQTQRRQAAKSSSASTPRYRGVVTTFQTILREEGWRAFYAGMGTNMMRAVPAATVTMLTYEYVMRELKRTRHDARQLLVQ